MGIISWIILGLIIGAIAKAIMKESGGLIVTLVLGVIGAFVGGLIGQIIFHVGLGDLFEIRTWVLALVGAVIVIALYRALTGKNKANT